MADRYYKRVRVGMMVECDGEGTGNVFMVTDTRRGGSSAFLVRPGDPGQLYKPLGWKNINQLYRPTKIAR